MHQATDGLERDRALVKDLSFSRIRERTKLGLVEFKLTKDLTIRAIGAVYGIEYELSEPTYLARILLDKNNQRLLVLSHETTKWGNLINRLESLSRYNSLDKIIYFAHTAELEPLIEHGFTREAHLHSFHQGNSAYFLSKFLSKSRSHSQATDEENQLLETILARKLRPTSSDRYKHFRFRIATKNDIPQILQIYRKVFDTYPSPLIHHDYFESVFQRSSIFYVATKGLENNEQIAAVASAELNPIAKAAELTDCATLSSFRGNGLMARILLCLEEELVRRNYACAFSLARARSFGMNLVFAKMGYVFRGRMVNNCDIQGAFEDMNVWEKRLI